MEEYRDYALKKIAKGAGIIFTSIILTYIFVFVYRIIAARYLGPSGYGLLSLSITILKLSTVVALLGLQFGVGKFVGFYMARKDISKTKGVLVSSLFFPLISSIVIAAVIYLYSGQISGQIFNMPDLQPMLKIFSIALPFSVLTQMLRFIFISFKKPQFILFSEVFGEKFVNLILTITIIIFGGTLLGISYVYLASLIIAFAAGFIILEKKVFSILSKKVKAKFDLPRLFRFAFPTIFTGILALVMAWTDTIFIGIFRTEADVGIYNVAYVLASSLMIFLHSFGDIFYPISSELHSKNKHPLIREMFEVVSKWIFITTLPFFLIAVVFPKHLISAFFGYQYVAGFNVIVILAIGYFLSSIMGPTTFVLQVYNKTKFVGFYTTVFAIVNIILNIILIPLYGIMGAAFATVISILSVNIIKFRKLKEILKFSLDYRAYAKFIIAAIIPLFFAYLVSLYFIRMPIIIKILVFAAYLVIYGILLIAFRCFSEHDIIVLNAMERKLGVNLNPVKRIIKRYFY